MTTLTRLLLLCIGFTLGTSMSSGQGLLSQLLPRDPQPVEHNLGLSSQYLGIGGIVLRDTYLSPLRYGGYTLSYLGEYSRLGYRLRRGDGESIPSRLPAFWPTAPRVADPLWLHHRAVSLDYAHTLNPAGNASIRHLQLRLDRSLMYRLGQGSWGRLYLGAGLRAGAGGLYSSRNGNNPATGRVDLALTATLRYGYQFPWVRFPARVRLMAWGDLLGMAFAQEFGENYYELYEQQSSLLNRLTWTHPANTLGYRLLLALDLPVWDYTTLSIGYRVQGRHAQLNHIRSRQSDHTLYLGITSYLRTHRGRQAVSDVATLPF